MSAVEFQAKIENGVIIIPDEYKHDFDNGNVVKVLILKQSRQPLTRDIIDELTENPVSVDGFLTRDEAHTSWQEFSQRFQKAAIEGECDTQEKILDLVRDVKQELAAERNRRLANKPT